MNKRGYLVILFVLMNSYQMNYAFSHSQVKKKCDLKLCAVSNKLPDQTNGCGNRVADDEDNDELFVVPSPLPFVCISVSV